MDLFASVIIATKEKLDSIVQTIALDLEVGIFDELEEHLVETVDSGQERVHCFGDTEEVIELLISDKGSTKKMFVAYSRILAHEEFPAGKFEMTTEQQNYAKYLIQNYPEFDQLRFELCPSHMRDGRFWQIYFRFLAERDHLGAPKDAIAEIHRIEVVTPRPALDDKEAPISVKHKGVKRERDNEIDMDSLKEDLATVSRLLYNGAKKTILFAEGILAHTDTEELVRNDQAEEVNIVSQVEEAIKGTALILSKSATQSSSRGSDTDDISVSSLDDFELNEWSNVNPKHGSENDDGFELV